MPTEKNGAEALMQACQRGVAGKGPAIESANNLLAECYGALGKLAAENEALRKDAESNKRMLLDACVQIGSVGEALGLDMDADADMMIGTARDLIDGLNRIIKECPLGSPGFAIATEVMGELGVQQEDQP